MAFGRPWAPGVLCCRSSFGICLNPLLLGRLILIHRCIKRRQIAMVVKSTVVLTALLFGLLTFAEAQQPYVTGGGPGPKTTLGWNWFHISSCDTHSDGTTKWLFVIAQEGGFGYTNNPAF